jgi:hypothetical protein
MELEILRAVKVMIMVVLCRSIVLYVATNVSKILSPPSSGSALKNLIRSSQTRVKTHNSASTVKVEAKRSSEKLPTIQVLTWIWIENVTYN